MIHIPSFEPFELDDLWEDPEIIFNFIYVDDDQSDMRCIMQLRNPDTSTNVTLVLNNDALSAYQRMFDVAVLTAEHFEATGEVRMPSDDDGVVVLPDNESIEDTINQILEGD